MPGLLEKLNILKNLKKELLKQLNETNQPIIAKYVCQRNLSDRLISDIHYIYEFKFNEKNHQLIYYPELQDFEPPKIPQLLDLKTITLKYDQLIL